MNPNEETGGQTGQAPEGIARGRRAISMLALVLANLVPLYGVLFDDWSIFFVMFVYWMENVVVGFFNVMRMAFASGDAAPRVRVGRKGRTVTTRPLPKAAAIPYFVFHFGLFALMHGVLVVALFGREGPGGGSLSAGEFAALVGDRLSDSAERASILWALAAMVLSHGISFVLNYLMDGEHRRVSAHDLMGRPYARVVALHIAVLFAALAAKSADGALWALVLLTVLKTLVDMGLISLEGRFRNG